MSVEDPLDLLIEHAARASARRAVIVFSAQRADTYVLEREDSCPYDQNHVPWERSRDWSGPVTAIVGFAVALVPVVGLIFTASTNRRAQYDRVLGVTALLTSGDVVESRHAAGIKFEAVAPLPPSTITNPVVNLTEEELKALFNVLWAFERINGLFVSLKRSWFSFRLSKAQKLLLDVSAGAITMWSSYAQFEIRDPSGKQIDLVPSKNGLVNLAEKLQVHQSR